MRCEITDLGRFGKRTPRRMHGIKNNLIWMKIHKKIEEQKLDRKSFLRTEKTNIKSKTNPLYDSKLKDNDTRQRIRRKTHNLKKIQLTDVSKAFHSAILKTKFGIQEVISPYSFDKILISSTPLMRKLI